MGGLVGDNQLGVVTTCYSTVAVEGGIDYTGGLVGRVNGEYGYGTVTTSFWDIETSGYSEASEGTGVPTREMQKGATFLDAGWDFVGETANGTEDIWWILEGKDYPHLWWEAAEK
ncbi:MAG: hypothetical protein A2Y76_03845 [Planctomycetes bacterium RBG_13_60_9]|nr:MAG: hypothetical protein A2Y76_03845 [Planctomycetes bacterium RBG_13_60_9]